jgi:hypothetical protein
MDRRKGTPLPISDNLLLTGAQENLIWQRRGRTTRSLSSLWNKLEASSCLIDGARSTDWLRSKNPVRRP